MRGHVRRRSPASWEYIVDVGMHAAERCQGCNKRLWVERRPKEVCPACGGRLIGTEERRRQTGAGFKTRKACAAAMNKLLVAVEEQSFVAPTKLSVRDCRSRTRHGRTLPALPRSSRMRLRRGREPRTA